MTSQMIPSTGVKKQWHNSKVSISPNVQLTVSGRAVSVRLVLLFVWTGCLATTRLRHPVVCCNNAIACWWEMFWSSGVWLIANIWSFSFNLWSLGEVKENFILSDIRSWLLRVLLFKLNSFFNGTTSLSTYIQII